MKNRSYPLNKRHIAPIRDYAEPIREPVVRRYSYDAAISFVSGVVFGIFATLWVVAWLNYT